MCSSDSDSDSVRHRHLFFFSKMNFTHHLTSEIENTKIYRIRNHVIIMSALFTTGIATLEL